MATEAGIPRVELSTSRLLALSDGIFSIAMTLLVFDVKVPTLAPGQTLLEALALLGPRFGACGLGFVTLGFSWIGHHNQYATIQRTDRTFLWINIGFLAAIAFMPFSSALLGSYPLERGAIITYALNLTLAGTLLYLHWSYACGYGRLVKEDTSPELVHATKRRVLIAPITYLSAAALSFVSPVASLVVFAAVPLYFMIPGRVDRHWVK